MRKLTVPTLVITLLIALTALSPRIAAASVPLGLTLTPTGSPTATSTATSTATPTATPTDTATPTPTGTLIILPPTPTATLVSESPTPTVTASSVVLPPLASPTPTSGPTKVEKPTRTPAPVLPNTGEAPLGPSFSMDWLSILLTLFLTFIGALTLTSRRQARFQSGVAPSRTGRFILWTVLIGAGLLAHSISMPSAYAGPSLNNSNAPLLASENQQPLPASPLDLAAPEADAAQGLASPARLLPAPASQSGARLPAILQSLSIHKIGLASEVVFVPFDGKTWNITGLGAKLAWLGPISTAQQDVTLLAGHVSVRNLGRGPFYYLEKLAPGDLITLTAGDLVYTYAVAEQRLIETNDVSFLDSSGKPRLALLTCAEWNASSETYLKRRLVLADFVKAEPIPAPKHQ